MDLTWGQLLVKSLNDLWMGFASFVPGFLIAVIIFIVGCILASVLGRALANVISALKIENLFKSAGAEAFFSRAGFRFSVGGFIGGLVKWFVVIVFLMTSFEILGLTQVNDFLRSVVLGYIPNVIVAAIVLIAATIISNAARKVVAGSAKAAHVNSANMLGTVVYYAIWVFAFIIALSQLGVARELMNVLFTGIIAMLAIAGGLAFGLGGKEAASRTIERLKSDMSSSHE